MRIWILGTSRGTWGPCLQVSSDEFGRSWVLDLPLLAGDPKFYSVVDKLLTVRNRFSLNLVSRRGTWVTPFETHRRFCSVKRYRGLPPLSRAVLRHYHVPTLCDPMAYSPPGSSVHGILQARILEWVAISFSRGSSWPSSQTQSPALQADSLLTELWGILQARILEWVQFSSVAQSCPTLCDPMNRSTPGLPVHHQLPEFTQTHVHLVSDAIQPSHPLSSPSPPALYLSQHIRVFSNESALCIRWPKYWSFSFSISPSNEHPGLISFRMDWSDLLAVQGSLKSLLQHHSSKASILQCSAWSR